MWDQSVVTVERLARQLDDLAERVRARAAEVRRATEESQWQSPAGQAAQGRTVEQARSAEAAAADLAESATLLRAHARRAQAAARQVETAVAAAQGVLGAQSSIGFGSLSVVGRA